MSERSFDIEGISIEGVAPVQAFGDFRGRDFYFRARYVYWHLELSNLRGNLPSDGGAGGFYRHGFAADASYLPTEVVESFIDGGLDEFEALLSELPPKLFEDGVGGELLAREHLAEDQSLDEAICRLLAIRAPRVTSELFEALDVSRQRVKVSLDRLALDGKVEQLLRGRGRYWMLKETATWLRFL